MFPSHCEVPLVNPKEPCYHSAFSLAFDRQLESCLGRMPEAIQQFADGIVSGAISEAFSEPIVLKALSFQVPLPAQFSKNIISGHYPVNIPLVARYTNPTNFAFIFKNGFDPVECEVNPRKRKYREF